MKKSDQNLKTELNNAKEDLKHATEHLANIAKSAKEKYEKTDDQTKKKIATALLGAAALIAGAIGVKKAIKKKNK